MNAFEEFMFDENYVLRFYRVDHGLVCTINESMVSELRELEAKLRQQQAEIEALKLQLHTTLTNRELRTYDGKLEWYTSAKKVSLYGLGLTSTHGLTKEVLGLF